jgi:hypothetical protein
VNGKNWWRWVWQNMKGSFFHCDTKRNYETVKQQFGENYTGTLVHDCYGAQNKTIA